MGLNQQNAVVDGIECSYADINIKFTAKNGALIETADVQSISSGTTIELGEKRGVSGGRVLSRTHGSESNEGSLTFYRAGWKTFYRALKASAPRRGKQIVISPVSFEVHVQFTPLNTDEIFEYFMKGCRIIGRNNTHTEGVDADLVEVPLSVLQIVDIDEDGDEVVLL